MAARWSLDQEIVKQCKQFFLREVQHWDTLTSKRTQCSEEEIAAKQQIIEAIFLVASAAAVRTEEARSPGDV